MITNLDIEWATYEDYKQIEKIEPKCFHKPWAMTDIRKHAQKSRIIKVARICQKVVGYIFYHFNYREIEIDRIAVCQQFRRRNIGSQLVLRLISCLADERVATDEIYERKKIITYIRERDLLTQLFFRSNGFVACKTLRDYFENEDCYLMVYFKEFAMED